MTDTRIINTPDLQIGDIVQCNGSRFRLTSYIVDAETANARWSKTSTYGHMVRNGESAEKVAEFIERERNLRAFKTEYLGPVSSDRFEAIPTHWRDTWTIQGNHLAYWAIEV